MGGTSIDTGGLIQNALPAVKQAKKQLKGARIALSAIKLPGDFTNGSIVKKSSKIISEIEEQMTSAGSNIDGSILKFQLAQRKNNILMNAFSDISLRTQDEIIKTNKGKTKKFAITGRSKKIENNDISTNKYRTLISRGKSLIKKTSAKAIRGKINSITIKVNNPYEQTKARLDLSRRITKKITSVTLSKSYVIHPTPSRGDGYTQKVKLDGRDFTLYIQQMGSYKDSIYHSTSKNTKSTISDTGCGPTSIAIVLSGFGIKDNPKEVSKKLYKLDNPSASKNMVKILTEDYGLSAKRHDSNGQDDSQKVYNEMKKSLEDGKQVVLWVGYNNSQEYINDEQGNKKYWKNFTKSGYHFISVLDIDPVTDKVFVGNSTLLNGKQVSGWYDLSTVVNARGHAAHTGHDINYFNGWIEISHNK